MKAPPPALKPEAVEDFIRGLTRSDRFAGRVVHVSEVAARPAEWAKQDGAFPPGVKFYLTSMNIARLYAHQFDAVEKIRAGRHVVVCTPTASGKTLTYTLPLLERLIEDSGRTALYLSPLKALAQDQLRKLRQAAALIPGLTLSASIYDGDTSGWTRKKIRELPPPGAVDQPGNAPSFVSRPSPEMGFVFSKIVPGGG